MLEGRLVMMMTVPHSGLAIRHRCVTEVPDCCVLCPLKGTYGHVLRSHVADSLHVAGSAEVQEAAPAWVQLSLLAGFQLAAPAARLHAAFGDVQA